MLTDEIDEVYVSVFIVLLFQFSEGLRFFKIEFGEKLRDRVQ